VSQQRSTRCRFSGTRLSNFPTDLWPAGRPGGGPTAPRVNRRDRHEQSLAGGASQDGRGQILAFDPGQDQESSVVDDTVQVLLALRGSPADVRVARRRLRGGGPEAEQGDEASASANEVAQLGTGQRLIAAVVVTVDVLVVQRRFGAMVHPLQLQRAQATRAVGVQGRIGFGHVHSDQAIYLQDPAPTVAAPRPAKGRASRRLKTAAVSITVAEWAATPTASACGRLSIRDGEKGEVMADYLPRRVWAWYGEAPSANRWHLLVRQAIDGRRLKSGLSNANPSAFLRRLAEMQGARHFVEQSFREAKGACGMAEYQVRRWQAWHHHMALVMIATTFLAKEHLAHRDTAELLSCRDLVEIMRQRLPTKVATDDDLAASDRKAA